jgi:hypothetical protein
MTRMSYAHILTACNYQIGHPRREQAGELRTVAADNLRASGLIDFAEEQRGFEWHTNGEGNTETKVFQCSDGSPARCD